MPRTNVSIVLDIDETLVSSLSASQELEFRRDCAKRTCLKYRKFGIEFYYDGEVKPTTVIKRLHLREFLDWCFDTFENVFVWSAGEKGYVSEIVRHIFVNHTPAAVWARDRCLVYNNHYVKPLDHVVDHFDLDDGGVMILEDRRSAMVPKDDDRFVLIPRYDPLTTKKYDDDELLKFMEWFDSCSDLAEVLYDDYDEVVLVHDVRTLIKPNQHVPHY